MQIKKIEDRQNKEDTMIRTNVDKEEESELQRERERERERLRQNRWK